MTSRCAYGGPFTKGVLYRMQHDLSAPLILEEEKEEDETEAEAEASATSKITHPLARPEGRDEVALWVHEVEHGALVPEARQTYNLPPETFSRCAWRRNIATEGTILSISMKLKRHVYAMIRTMGEDITHDTLLPSLGVTVGQLCVWQILARSVKPRPPSLADVVDQSGIAHPAQQQSRVLIHRLPPKSPPLSPSIAAHGDVAAILHFIKYGHAPNSSKTRGETSSSKTKGRGASRRKKKD